MTAGYPAASGAAGHAARAAGRASAPGSPPPCRPLPVLSRPARPAADNCTRHSSGGGGSLGKNNTRDFTIVQRTGPFLRCSR